MKLSSAPLVAASLLALAACNDKAEDGPGAAPDSSADSGGWRPELACPGDEGCASNEGELRAGAAKRAITPTCLEAWTDADSNHSYQSTVDSFEDCGCDQLCEGDAGYPGPDRGEGDGQLQTAWMAGFGNGRAASGVHDDLWARAVVFESGDTRVGLVVLDVVGFFYDDVLRVRQAAAAADLDWLIVQSTHTHEGPDTMGQWGPNLTTPGKDPVYVDMLVEQAGAAVVEAANSLTAARLTAGVVDSASPFGSKGTRNLIRDSRDPVIIDELVYVAHLADGDGQTIATLVNWGNHPETLSSSNTLITSDYPHYLRQAVEDGVSWNDSETPGLGGICIFTSASVGGMMTPLGVTVTDGNGVDHSASDWDKAEAIGKLVGELAIGAVMGGEVATDPRVSFGVNTLYIPVHNEALRLAHALGVLDRQLHNYDPSLAISDYNRPEVLTELGLVDVGPIRMLAIPGELLPELAVGGYDGSRVNTDEDTLIGEDNPNPPDLSAAPAGPYFKDQMGRQYNWILGLANDELGYLVPPYDYEVHPTLPYLNEPEGDHYEETNSLGPDAVPMLSALVDQLTAWAP